MNAMAGMTGMGGMGGMAGMTGMGGMTGMTGIGGMGGMAGMAGMGGMGGGIVGMNMEGGTVMRQCMSSPTCGKYQHVKRKKKYRERVFITLIL